MTKDKITKSGPDANNSDREARLGAALRANLRRRKDQSRAKSAETGQITDKPGDSARNAEVKDQTEGS